MKKVQSSEIGIVKGMYKSSTTTELISILLLAACFGIVENSSGNQRYIKIINFIYLVLIA